MIMRLFLDKWNIFNERVWTWSTGGHKEGEIDNYLNSLSTREYREFKWMMRELNRAMNEFDRTLE